MQANPRTTPNSTPPTDNRLLAALSADEWCRWQPYLVPVELVAGQVLCEAGNSPASVYFPVTAIVSLLHLTREGQSAEFAVIGDDGMVGLPVFMGGHAMPGQAVVQTSGRAWRIGAAVLRHEALVAGPLLAVLLRYAQALIAQVAQTAICNRFHSIDAQLCRRLLLGLDRSAGDELLMTQDGLAQLLGVRREGVTAAALRLQLAGVIQYRRGRITVLDRDRLESRSCECYAAAKTEYDRLMNPAAHRVGADCCAV